MNFKCLLSNCLRIRHGLLLISYRLTFPHLRSERGTQMSDLGVNRGAPGPDSETWDMPFDQQGPAFAHTGIHALFRSARAMIFTILSR
jgi:hypothetical protein